MVCTGLFIDIPPVTVLNKPLKIESWIGRCEYIEYSALEIVEIMQGIIYLVGLIPVVWHEDLAFDCICRIVGT